MDRHPLEHRLGDVVRYLRARRAEAQAREQENVDADVVIIATEVQPIPANAPIGPGLA